MTFSNRDSQAPLWAFFALPFLLSWAAWLAPVLVDSPTTLQNVGAFGPAVAAIALALSRRGRRGVRELVARMTQWRAPPVYYAVALLGPPLVMVLAVGAHLALGGTLTWYGDPAHPTLPADGVARVLGIPLVFAVVLVSSVIGEELGWRAHALPRLLGRWQPITASVVLGGAWALWHLPLFLTPGVLQQRLPVAWFVGQLLGQSLLMTWLFRRSGGSALPATLLHAAANTSVGLLPVLPLDAGGSARMLWIVLALEWVAVAVVMFHPRLRGGLQARVGADATWVTGGRLTPQGPLARM